MADPISNQHAYTHDITNPFYGSTAVSVSPLLRTSDMQMHLPDAHHNMTAEHETMHDQGESEDRIQESALEQLHAHFSVDPDLQNDVAAAAAAAAAALARSSGEMDVGMVDVVEEEHEIGGNTSAAQQLAREVMNLAATSNGEHHVPISTADVIHAITTAGYVPNVPAPRDMPDIEMTVDTITETLTDTSFVTGDVDTNRIGPQPVPASAANEPLQGTDSQEHIQREMLQQRAQSLQQRHLHPLSQSQRPASSAPALGFVQPAPGARLSAPPVAAGDGVDTGTTLGGRLRSKVSRACDECRRKKIRCDAPVENETASCTGCLKGKISCQFSRTPQKRGPSKGYIKELADRVSSLEGQLHGRAPISDKDDPFVALSATGAEVSPLNPGVKRPRTEPPLDGFSPGRKGGNMADMMQRLDDGLVTLYYHYIHPILTIFPTNVQEFRRDLAAKSRHTKNAALAAIECTLRATHYTYTDVPSDVIKPTRTLQLYYNALMNDKPSVALVQTLLLLWISANNCQSLTLEPQSPITPNQHLSSAITMAVELGLFRHEVSTAGPEDFVKRNVALNLSILNMYAAFADKRDYENSLPERFPQLMPNDEKVISERTLWLTRFAVRLYDVLTIKIQPANQPHMPDSKEFNPVTKRIAADDTNTLPSICGMHRTILEVYHSTSLVSRDPILALAYWYTLGLIETHLYPLMEARRMLYTCQRMLEVLNHLDAENAAAVAPLLHHYAGFVAHTLLQLGEFTDTAEKAEGALADLEVILTQRVVGLAEGGIAAGVRGVVVNRHGRRREGGLEDLASAAVAGSTTPLGEPGGQENPIHVGDANDERQDDGVVAAAEAAAAAAKQIQMDMRGRSPDDAGAGAGANGNEDATNEDAHVQERETSERNGNASAIDAAAEAAVAVANALSLAKQNEADGIGEDGKRTFKGKWMCQEGYLVGLAGWLNGGGRGWR